MSKAEQKRIEARIQRALDRLQRRLGVEFEWVLSPNSGVEATFQIERSNRGVEDPVCFSLEYNPDLIEAETLADLRSDIYHEILHAMTWNWWEALLKWAPRSEWIELRKRVYEPAIYEIERRTRKYVV